MRHVCVAFDATWSRIVFAAAALVVAPAIAGSARAQEQGQVLVSNYYGDSVTMYQLPTTGDKPPALIILDAPNARPHQIAINHRASELIVANNAEPFSVTVYDRLTGLLKRTLAGPSTGLNRPTGVAIDEAHREIYVANDWGRSITVYDELATGDVSPKRTITSPVMLAPVGLAIDVVHDEIIVAEYGFQSILTFDRSASGPTDDRQRCKRSPASRRDRADRRE